MDRLVLLLGDQLFPEHPSFPPDAPILMQEDVGLATRVRHHQQKIVLFFSAMRHHARALKKSGKILNYHEYHRGAPSIIERVHALNPGEIHAYRPSDRFFEKELHEAFGERLVWHENQSFLTPEDRWRRYAKGKRRLMGDFYKLQRRELGILLDAQGEPLGGKWSFDEENRESLPKGAQPPAIPWYKPDSIRQQVIALVESEFSEHPGKAADFRWPVTREEALDALDRFLEDRFAKFGPFEDAIAKDHTFLWHSLLSPLINIGLLTPKEVVQRAIQSAEMRAVPLQSIEGFIRQIIGWREFIYWIDREYETTGADQRNFFGHQRRLKPCWWTAETGLPPLDGTIRRVRDYAWCHHIERLMVAGAAMLMCEVHPEEAYRWFMEMFIDSADWVMAPNVFGMSQFSDGGVFATKPYLSGSAYLLRMSDYPKGPWCDVWDGLYWRFMDCQREFFAKNPRMAQIARGVDRLAPDRRERIFTAADAFIERVTEPAP